MEGDRKSCPYQLHIDGQTTDLNSTDVSTIKKHFSTYMDSWHDTIATHRSFSVSPLDEPPQPRIGHAEPHSWFYCLPTFRQAMFPPLKPVLKEQLLTESQTNGKKDENLNAGSQLPLKKFLVFDQTGDQTTLIFSSGVGAPPVHCLSHWNKNQAEAYLFHPQQEGRNMMGNSGTILTDGFIDINQFDEDRESGPPSEMHEDTEELNALMYSDDDTYSDDDEDEVNSTGHCSSTLTGHKRHYEFGGIKEEVASSDEEPTKWQKLSDGGNGVAQTEGCITLNHGTLSFFEDDTESHRGSGKVCDSGKPISLSGKKRAREDLVRETVRTLQRMIPGGKGATPMEVIDEAINFLKSLKLKANSLGFDSM